jgi:hypothetical protein
MSSRLFINKKWPKKVWRLRLTLQVQRKRLDGVKVLKMRKRNFYKSSLALKERNPNANSYNLK